MSNVDLFGVLKWTYIKVQHQSKRYFSTKGDVIEKPQHVTFMGFIAMGL